MSERVKSDGGVAQSTFPIDWCLEAPCPCVGAHLRAWLASEPQDRVGKSQTKCAHLEARWLHCAALSELGRCSGHGGFAMIYMLKGLDRIPFVS